MSKGRDTIGKGTANPGKRTDINAGSRGDIHQGDKKLGREGWRSNTVSGQDKTSGPTESKGARLVGDVMLKQETKGRGPDQQNADRLASGNAGGVKFTIGDNVAKKIDRDAPPR